jgi:hypothetical protein
MQEDNQQSVDMTPEEAKASLGLATRLSEQMLMAQFAQMGGGMPQEAPQDAQNAPEQENGGEKEETSDLRKQYENEPNDEKLDEVLDEIKSIKEEIKQVLEEDDNEQENEQES